MTTWIYPPELADALATLGFAPSSSTQPALVRDGVNDLYRWELRRMRDRLRQGLTARSDYVAGVVGLRKKYWMLTLPLAAWERICSQQPPPERREGDS